MWVRHGLLRSVFNMRVACVSLYFHTHAHALTRTYDNTSEKEGNSPSSYNQCPTQIETKGEEKGAVQSSWAEYKFLQHAWRGGGVRFWNT